MNSTPNVAKGGDLMSLSDKYYIYLYTYVIICQYVVYVTYLMMYNGFVCMVADYPQSVWELISFIYFLFSQVWKHLANIEIAATLYSFTYIMKIVYMYLKL